MAQAKRARNERTFGTWRVLSNGGRLYGYDVPGRSGWARYLKETDADEHTVRFYQEVYDSEGHRREVHHKYPVDLGHRREGDDEP